MSSSSSICRGGSSAFSSRNYSSYGSRGQPVACLPGYGGLERRRRKNINGLSLSFSVAMQKPNSSSANGKLQGKSVAFTTPHEYASRLQQLLQLEGAQPLWCPTIVVESTPHTRQEVEELVWGSPVLQSAPPPLSTYKSIAFTSRAGIRAMAEVLQGRQNRLGRDLGPFIVAALGRDAELIRDLELFQGIPSVSILVPSVATPEALVKELGNGKGQRILCPVPLVEGLEEPSVVPNFLQGLRSNGWDAVRLNAYLTRWAGPDCAKPLLALESVGNAGDLLAQKNQGLLTKPVDALIFTSTAEVEGLIKSLNALGVGGGGACLSKGEKRVVTAAHGPVTAAGAARLGVKVDVVSKRFESFAGIIDALALYWESENR